MICKNSSGGSVDGAVDYLGNSLEPDSCRTMPTVALELGQNRKYGSNPKTGVVAHSKRLTWNAAFGKLRPRAARKFSSRGSVSAHHCKPGDFCFKEAVREDWPRRCTFTSLFSRIDHPGFQTVPHIDVDFLTQGPGIVTR